MKRMLKKPYRICVARQLGGVGDLIMTTPVYRGLKEKYPGCHLTVATTWIYGAGALPELLKHNPFIDEVVRVEPMEYAPEMLRTNKREYANVPNDRVPFCVEHCDEFIELNVICSIVETRTQPNVTQHRTDIWCEHAQVNPSSCRPILNLTAEELAEGRQWVDQNMLASGPKVGLVLKAMSWVREWPYVDQFAVDLMRAGFSVVTIDPVKRVHDNIPALIGKRIRFVASVIANLDAVVSPDTGLLHVAGALGVPILGLFGSTDGAMRMREYAGHYTLTNRFVSCGPCWYHNSCTRNPDPEQHLLCMKKISRRLVLHELEVMLERFGKCRQAFASTIPTG